MLTYEDLIERITAWAASNPDVRAALILDSVFARYNARDIARALRTTMDLYRWLEDETATHWGYSPQRQGEQAAASATILLLEQL